VDETLTPKPVNILPMDARAVLGAAQLVHRDNAKRAGGCKHTHLRAPQRALPPGSLYRFPGAPSREVQFPSQCLAGLASFDRSLGAGAAPAATGHFRPIPLNVTWVDVSIHTHTPSHIQVRPEVVEGGVRRTQLPVEVQEFAAGVSKE
jgi:hypothetical protein